MSTRRALVIAVVLIAFHVSHASADQELLRVWQAPATPVRERAAAVNRAFTNGTPMATVVAALGTNYVRFTPFSSVWVGPGPEPRKPSGLIYSFGNESVIIGTTADISADPLTGRFTAAGHSIPVTQPTTNQIRIGQQHGAVNGSQPIRSERNRTSSAAGSRR
jgi:hypothetical protein